MSDKGHKAQTARTSLSAAVYEIGIPFSNQSQPGNWIQIAGAGSKLNFYRVRSTDRLLAPGGTPISFNSMTAARTVQNRDETVAHCYTSLCVRVDSFHFRTRLKIQGNVPLFRDGWDE